MKLIRLITSAAFAAALTMTSTLQAADEAAALKVLASADADLHAKAMACDELGRVGTVKAVPVLTRLLADEKLHDYARDGLERIKDPAAGKALLGSLKSLKGNLRTGVIISLGDRREKAAVAELAKIARMQGKNVPVATAALNSLAQIATDEAGEAILKILAEGHEEAKAAAPHAALAAAQRMEKAGSKEIAAKLRKAAAAAGVPAPVNQKVSVK